MPNLLYSLPDHLIRNVFEFDRTYHAIFNICLLEMMLNFNEHREINKILRNMFRRKITFIYFAENEIGTILHN
jgi:hypothetical protein